jgi:hypothetical protein
VLDRLPEGAPAGKEGAVSATAEIRDTTAAHALIAAIAAGDFAALGACFAPSCRLRAFTPNNIFAAMTREGAVASFRAWLGDAESIEVIEQEVKPLSDRYRIRYLLEVVENGERTLVEQAGYLDLAEDAIVDLTLICSGHRPFVESGNA